MVRAVTVVRVVATELHPGSKVGPWRALVCSDDLRARAGSWSRAAAFFR